MPSHRSNRRRRSSSSSTSSSPDVDGFEVASRLLERRPGLAIVLVSVRDRSDYGSLVEQSGARGFVSKADLSGATLAGLLESEGA